jgi:hypothetical protein
MEQNPNQPKETSPEHTKPPEGANFIDSIPAELRGEQVLSNVKSIGDMATQLVNLNKVLGEKRVAIPKEGASAEEMASFRKALGHPNSKDDYGLKDKATIEKLGINYLEPVHDALTNGLYEQGLDKTQANGVYDKYLEAVKSVQEATNKTALEQKAKWEMQNKDNYAGQDFNEVTEIRDRGLAWAGSEAKQVFEGSNLLDNPEIFNLLYKVGQMTSETQAPGGGGSTPNSKETAQAELDSLYKDDKFTEGLMDVKHPNYRVNNDRIMQLNKTIHGEEIVAELNKTY